MQIRVTEKNIYPLATKILAQVLEKPEWAWVDS